MSLRIDVPQARVAGLRFPARCPVCGKSEPDSVIPVRLAEGLSALLPTRKADGKYLQVPGCERCRHQLQRGRVFSGLVLGMCLGLTTFVWSLARGPLMATRWADIGLLMALTALAVFLKHRFYQTPFEALPYQGQVMLVFGKEDIAREFAGLNGFDTGYDGLSRAVSLRKEPPRVEHKLAPLNRRARGKRELAGKDRR